MQEKSHECEITTPVERINITCDENLEINKGTIILSFSMIDLDGNINLIEQISLDWAK